MEKIIVITAPSGAGKTSIVRSLLNRIPSLSFSISATSREKREDENEGKDYYFFSVDQFKSKIKEYAFLEWEEVYKKQFYGTLKSEITRIKIEGKTVIFDVDVSGALNIKKKYGKECLAIFIMPPSIDILRERLSSRGSETSKTLEIRLKKAELEIYSSNKFDKVILNDDLELASDETHVIIKDFINL